MAESFLVQLEALMDALEEKETHSMLTVSLDTVKEAMRKELMQEIEKSYLASIGAKPNPTERAEAEKAIEELLLSLDVDKMSAGDLESIAVELGLQGSAKAAKKQVKVFDRRQSRN